MRILILLLVLVSGLLLAGCSSGPDAQALGAKDKQAATAATPTSLGKPKY